MTITFPGVDDHGVPDRAAAALLDVNDVAELLHCSTRHVYRLADGGKMPRPVKLGALVRWRGMELAEWIAKGCPPVRAVPAKGGGR